MLGYTVSLAGLFGIAFCFCRQLIWYKTDPLYLILKFTEYILSPLLLLAGWICITYRCYFRKKQIEPSHTAAVKRLKRKTLLQYFAAIIIFTVIAFFLIYMLQYYFSTIFVWRDDDQMRAISNLFVSLMPLSIGIGWICITIRFFAKPFSYLLEIVHATAQLEQRPEEPIALPDAVKAIQDEFNLLREQSNRNAAAAKEAEQRKNDLIVYLAHDLKTPLTSIIGYMTLLRDEPQLSPEMRAKYTGIAVKKAERLEELINEFFEITRFNLTHMELEYETINLSRMLEQITFEFQPILAEKHLQWDLHMTPNIELVCDPEKLERVIDNLIRNAISYSYPDTTIFVSLETEKTEAILKFCNHGKTISAEKLSRIFDQFFRADAARASSTGGAGLGLAIAKQIVELHGGFIRAESADENIRFTVNLPLRQKIV